MPAHAPEPVPRPVVGRVAEHRGAQIALLVRVGDETDLLEVGHVLEGEATDPPDAPGDLEPVKLLGLLVGRHEEHRPRQRDRVGETLHERIVLLLDRPQARRAGVLDEAGLEVIETFGTWQVSTCSSYMKAGLEALRWQ